MASSASTSTLVNDFDGFNATLQKALLSTTRAANGIPGPSDLQFQRTLSRPTGRKVDDVSKRLLHLTEQMLGLAREGTHSLMSTKDAKGKGKETHGKPAKKARELREEDLIDGYSKHVVEITDHLLELMDTNLDEHRKMLVQQAAAASSSSSAGSALPQPGAAGTSASPFATVPTTSASYAGSANKGRLPKEILNSVETAKPQLLFDNPLDNARHAIFTPILPSKVHARVPLSLEAVPYTDTETGENRLRIPNPYVQEIMESLSLTLPSEPTAEGMDVDDAPQRKMDSRMHEKPFTFVDTLDKLDECLQKLKLAKVIAIDLEHHDYRSYRGFTSLVQVGLPASSQRHLDCADSDFRPYHRSQPHWTTSSSTRSCRQSGAYCTRSTRSLRIRALSKCCTAQRATSSGCSATLGCTL
jgi:exosome complex exonuclease RRP6